MSNAWAKGSTPQWRRLRLQILARDKYTCQLKLPDICTTKATHVHHLIGKEHGDDPKLLVATCAPCNLKTGNPNKKPDPKPKPITQW